jgi:hypothetical protein
VLAGAYEADVIDLASSLGTTDDASA